MGTVGSQTRPEQIEADWSNGPLPRAAGHRPEQRATDRSSGAPTGAAGHRPETEARYRRPRELQWIEAVGVTTQSTGWSCSAQGNSSAKQQS